MINWKSLKNKIPTKVQVGRNAYYEVLWADTLGTENSPNLGECRFDTKQIMIKTRMSPKKTVTTYVHEYIHAISNEHNCNLTENQVLSLENALNYILKDDNIFKKGKK